MQPQYSRYYTYIKPFLKNKYVKTYSSAVFSMITITIFAFFAIRPTVSTIVSLQKSLDQQQQLLDKINTKAEQLSEAKKNYEQLDIQSKDNLVSLLPNSTNLPSLIQSISDLTQGLQASSSGLQFQPVDLDGPPNKLQKTATIKEIDFTLNIQGSYSRLNTLLENLTRNNRLIKISSVNFNKPVDESLIMTINAKAYYLKN